MTGVLMASMMSTPYMYGGYEYQYDGEQAYCNQNEGYFLRRRLLSTSFTAVSGSGPDSSSTAKLTTSPPPAPPTGSSTSPSISSIVGNSQASLGTSTGSSLSEGNIAVYRVCAKACTPCSFVVNIDQAAHKWSCTCSAALSTSYSLMALGAVVALAMQQQG